MACKVTVITPVYNESKTLERSVALIKKALEHIPHEIIIVDDNSPDGSGVIADHLASLYENVKVLHRPKKLGLGTAYKEGFTLSVGDFIVTMDSDLSHDPNYIPSMIKKASNYDIVIGSRLVPGGRILGRTPIRDFLSIYVNKVIRSFTCIGIHDWTSGLRLYRRGVWEQVMPLVHCDKWDFQFESLYKAYKTGYTATELPVTFYERAEGESKFSLREGLFFLMSFIKIMVKIK
jgi:dolichol-phosphate mannosyltransferase